MFATRPHIPTHGSRAAIDAALPYLKFEKIPVLFYARHLGDELQEVEEFGDHKGLLVSTKSLPNTMVAGNRVSNEHEIWLHPDGSVHKYLRTATWETLESGCTQRQYVGPAPDEEIILDELLEAIAFNFLAQEEENDDDEEAKED